MFKVNRILNAVFLVLVGFMVSQDGVASYRHAWQDSVMPVLSMKHSLTRLYKIDTYAVTNNPAFERVKSMKASTLFGLPDKFVDENLQLLPVENVDYQALGRTLVVAYTDPFRQEFSDGLIPALNISLWRFRNANQHPQIELMRPNIIILTDQTYQALSSFIDLGIYKGACLPVVTFVADKGGEIRKALKYTKEIRSGTLPLLLMGGGYGKVLPFDPLNTHEPGNLTKAYAHFEIAVKLKQKHD